MAAVLDAHAGQHAVVGVAKGDENGVNAIVDVVNVELGKDSGHLGVLKAAADPVFLGGLGGGVDDPLVAGAVEARGRFKAADIRTVAEF